MKYTTIIISLAMMLAACSAEKVEHARQIDSAPGIFPDYTDVTVPVNIAPLNFCSADSSVQLIDVVISGAKGSPLHLQSDGTIDIDIDDWHALLADNAGNTLSVTVSTKSNGKWSTYRPFDIHVSPDSIDYGIAYRLVAPGYEKYSNMGIYARSLGDFDETAVFENTQVEGCVNCHSFRVGDPSYMSMHVRGPHGATMLRTPSLPMDVYNTKTDSTTSPCVYPYWHPDGRFIAYSANQTRQSVHMNPERVLEVFDLESDVHVYDTSTGRLLIPRQLRNDSIWETFPSFSPDGKSLYFSAAKAVAMPGGEEDIRYDICRIAFDPATGTFGEKIDTLVNASAQGRSATFARPSYDGRYLIYTLADYGTFPIWHDEADLWLLDLSTMQSRPLDTLNSPRTESYHSFSTNSRWIVFSSRRLDGRHTTPYIAHIGADGSVGKPFLLPQRDPRAYYDGLFRSFNIPEFTIAPVELDRNALERKLTDPSRRPFAL